MKCAYHPQKDAVTKCSRCQKPLCDECAGSVRDKEAVCSHCAIILAAQDASLGVNERREERYELRLRDLVAGTDSDFVFTEND